jgi:hypothetical protein
MEAIQSLCTLLLGEVAPLPPPTPSILPTPPPPTPVVDKDEPIINLFSLPCLPTTSTPMTSTPTATLLQSLRTMAKKTHLIPSQITCQPCHHLICPLQNRPLTRNQLRLCSAHVIDCVIVEELMPTPALCTHPPSLNCGYAFAAECILLETISPPSHSTIHIIGAINDNITGNVLKN